MSVIKISLAALERNIEKCRSMTDAKIMAVLKCNGYGMGIVEYAKRLKSLGITSFAVSRPDEAMALRRAGFDGELVLLTAMWEDEVITALAAKNVALTISCPENDDKVRSVLLSRGLSAVVHIAVDTGMHRYGFTPDELKAYSPDGAPYTPGGIFTHFYASLDREITAKQH
ncbi:MAG: alanine racemase, partial [Oscillospiraceae bacterium]|nr:alanine racemase [Oscillospiraceae bacterium]